LLTQYKKTHTNALDKHFALIALQDFYYKYRDLDGKYLQTCIAYCKEDIALLPQVQIQYKREEKENIQKLATVYSKKEIAERLADVKNFNSNIPAFKRLAVIYEKHKDYSIAIGICDQAIAYYNGIGCSSVAIEFAERKSKLEAKAEKM